MVGGSFDSQPQDVGPKSTGRIGAENESAARRQQQTAGLYPRLYRAQGGKNL
jgi:hypothetical protein